MMIFCKVRRIRSLSHKVPLRGRQQLPRHVVPTGAADPEAVQQSIQAD